MRTPEPDVKGEGAHRSREQRGILQCSSLFILILSVKRKIRYARRVAGSAFAVQPCAAERMRRFAGMCDDDACAGVALRCDAVEE